jgi:hypothetical protein
LVCHRRHGRAPAAPPRNRRRQHTASIAAAALSRPGAGCGATGWIGVFRATSCGSPHRGSLGRPPCAHPASGIQGPR